MDILLFPLRLIYKIYFALFFGLSLLVFYPFFKFNLIKKERFPKAFKLMKFYGKFWIFCVGNRLKITGKENIPKNQAYLICGNHSSFLDIPSLYAIFDEYLVFTGKKEFEKWPLFRVFYVSGMNIAVDRENKAGAMQGFKKMMQTIDDGHPLVIFPEGTISKTAPKLTEFKTGAVTIAIQKQIPILPITFTTSWKRLQRKGLFKGKASPGAIEVIIHPIIQTKGLNKKDKEALQNKLKSTINQPLLQKYGV